MPAYANANEYESTKLCSSVKFMLECELKLWFLFLAFADAGSL
jgi:hypothetical protein